MAMTLRLSEALDKDLTTIATRKGISKQQVVENAIEKYVESESQYERLRVIFDFIAERDAELLRRLADA
jgi:predicted transcriptional regulator